MHDCFVVTYVLCCLQLVAQQAVPFCGQLQAALTAVERTAAVAASHQLHKDLRQQQQQVGDRAAGW
jgi:hypothetical protein